MKNQISKEEKKYKELYEELVKKYNKMVEKHNDMLTEMKEILVMV